jgi:hypothetical protein
MPITGLTTREINENNTGSGGSHTYNVDGYAVTGWPNEEDFDYDLWKIINKTI